MRFYSEARSVKPSAIAIADEIARSALAEGQAICNAVADLLLEAKSRGAATIDLRGVAHVGADGVARESRSAVGRRALTDATAVTIAARWLAGGTRRCRTQPDETVLVANGPVR